MEELLKLVLNCSHTISANAVTLRCTPGRSGNALNQLTQRLRTFEIPLQPPQVVGRVWKENGDTAAVLNSVGRDLPDSAPLFSAPVAQDTTRPDPNLSHINLDDLTFDDWLAELSDSDKREFLSQFWQSHQPGAENYKAMFEDAVRSLAAIDKALDITPDESGGAGPILEAIAALKKGGAGEAAMQSACAELPEGYELHVCLEEGAGWIDLYDPHGAKVDVTEDMDGGMTPRIIDGIKMAVVHAEMDRLFPRVNAQTLEPK